MNELAITILKEKKLKITQNRLDVLSVFLKEQKAFSLLDLELIYGKKHDRSSIFRFLQICSEHKILEKFVDKSGVAVYVINHNEDQKNHSHYKCSDCQTVVNLPKLPDEYLALLGKNKVETTNLFLEGTCEQCQNDNK